MATVKAFIRISTKKANDVNVRFRLSDGRNIQLFHKSELTVNSDLWDEKNQCIKAKVIFDTEKRTTFNKAVMARKELLIDVYNANPRKDELTSDLLDVEIDKVLNPHKYFVPVEKERNTATTNKIAGRITLADVLLPTIFLTKVLISSASPMPFSDHAKIRIAIAGIIILNPSTKLSINPLKVTTLRGR